MEWRPRPAPVRVLLVDDLQLFREGVARLLARDERISVVGQAEDGEEAVHKAGSLLPDLVLMDIQMPRLDGIHAARRIVSEHPSIKVLMLAAEQTDESVVESLRAGAVGYLAKDIDGETLRKAVVDATEGQAVLDRSGQRAVVTAALERGESPPAPRGLTQRQFQILRLMAGGFGLKQIGRELGLAPKTVRNEASQIYAKLRVHDRLQAVLYAMRKGLVS